MLAADRPLVGNKHNMAEIEKDEDVVDLVAGDTAGKKKKKKKKKKAGKNEDEQVASLAATGSQEGDGEGDSKAGEDAEVAKKAAEAEAQRAAEMKAAEDAKKAEEERVRKEKEEEERKKAEELERQKKEEEERKRKEAEEAKEKAEEEARLKVEQEAKLAAEEAKAKEAAAAAAAAAATAATGAATKTDEEEEEEEEETDEEGETDDDDDEEEEEENTEVVAPKSATLVASESDDAVREDKGKAPAPVLETTTIVQQQDQPSGDEAAAPTQEEGEQALTLQRRDTYERAKLEQRVAEQDISLFTRFDRHKHVVLRKTSEESLGFMITETSRQALLPCIFISHIFPGGAASRSGELMVGDTILSVNGTSVVGLPFPKILDLFKVASQAVKIELIVVPVEPVVVVTVSRSASPNGKLGFDVLHGEIVSVDRDGPAHKAGLRAGHRITEINGVSVVDCPHEKIVEFLQANEVKMKTMPKDLYHTLVASFPPPSP